MRVKPWVMTVSGTLVALAALGIVVSSTAPSDASTAHQVVFWASLALSFWGLLATLLLWCRLNLSQAVWCALLLSVGCGGAYAVVRWGGGDPRLLAGIGLATLSLSFFAWYRLRHG
jgi:hypothetical protein